MSQLLGTTSVAERWEFSLLRGKVDGVELGLPALSHELLASPPTTWVCGFSKLHSSGPLLVDSPWGPIANQVQFKAALRPTPET